MEWFIKNHDKVQYLLKHGQTKRIAQVAQMPNINCEKTRLFPISISGFS